MYQFFVGDDQVFENKIQIVGSDVNHIGNVLRMKPGVKVRVSDESGRAYFCTIESISENDVWVMIDEIDEKGTELPCRIVLFQGLPKGDKMELIIQKAVELGVNEIVPVAMKNCVMRLDEKKVDKKIERWQNIAESAAKQSKRTIIPKISKPMKYKQALEAAKELDITLVPYENQRGMEQTREIIDGIAEKPSQSIGIIVGPEGGFAADEIAMVDELDSMHRISLGRRILRTETAGMATLAMLVYRLD